MSAAGGAARERAVVIGAGITGLCAARVLADRFREVVLLERDRLHGDAAAPRPGTPHARHAHFVLRRGEALVEALFPGALAELVAAGACEIDWTRDFAVLHPTGWGVRFASGLVTRTCTRDLIESVLRRRVRALANVRVADGAERVRLVHAPRAGRITAVGWQGAARLECALVVDASGRGSQLPDWLAELGLPAPPETLIRPFAGYATRHYERPAGFDADWKMLGVLTRPPTGSRGGVLTPVEGGRWVATLFGTARDYPPTDEGAFLEYARSLPTPELHRALAAARPITPVYGFRAIENRWRHYERLRGWPDGLVVLGDAVCSFNPMYGQGITMGVRAVHALRDALGRDHDDTRDAPWLRAGFAQRFQRRLARAYRVAWLMATTEDYRWPSTEGPRPGVATRALHGWIDRTTAVAVESPEVRRTFLDVMHMVRSPAALAHPRVIARVLR